MKVNVSRGTPVYLPTPEADKVAREMHQAMCKLEEDAGVDLSILKKVVTNILHSKDPEGTKMRNLANVYRILRSKDTFIQGRLWTQIEPKEEYMDGKHILELLRTAGTLDNNKTV